jgi:hypothetical protein
LAIYGARDLQVDPQQNIAPLKAALARNRHATVIELAELNHMFQHAETGSPTEYVGIAETFAPEALETMTRWILRQTR